MILSIIEWAVAVVVVTAFFLIARSSWLIPRQKPCCCQACRRLDRSPRHPAVAAELKRHITEWENEFAPKEERP
jgi:hypothetical protein